MKKKIGVFVLAVALLAMVFLSMTACSHNDIAGKYFLYEGEVKTSSFIEIKKRSAGVFTTGDSATRGSFTLSNGNITFYVMMLGEKVILLEGTITLEGVLTLTNPRKPDEPMILKKEEKSKQSEEPSEGA